MAYIEKGDILSFKTVYKGKTEKDKIVGSEQKKTGKTGKGPKTFSSGLY